MVSQKTTREIEIKKITTHRCWRKYTAPFDGLFEKVKAVNRQ